MASYTKLTTLYNNLILTDTSGFSSEKLELHYEKMHGLDMKIKTLEVAKLKPINDLLSKESEKIKSAVVRLSDTALNDEKSSVVFNTISSTAQIMDSVITTIF